MNGEASVGALKAAMKLHHDPHPWDDLWRAVAVEHPVRDAWWDERNRPAAARPASRSRSTSAATGRTCRCTCPARSPRWPALTSSPNVRVALLGDYGLTWPWESLHVEALAWFDHWLKGRDTGILDGPPIRYVLPGADEWRTADTWPPPGTTHRELALRADGVLGDDEGAPGTRGLPDARRRPQPRPAPAPPTRRRLLTWTSEPLTDDLDVVGDIELRLDASATALDTAWIVTLQDVAPDGTADRRHRRLPAGQPARGRRGREPPGRAGARPAGTPQAVPVGEVVRYRDPAGAQRPAVRGRPPDPARASPATTRTRTLPRSWGSGTRASGRAPSTRCCRRHASCCPCCAH